MRPGVFGYLALCAVLVSAGCAKEDVVKKDEPITTAPAPAEAKPAPAPAPKAPAPAQEQTAQPEAAPAPRQPAGEPVEKKAEPEAREAAPLSALEKIYFDFDSAGLSDASRDQLKKNFDILKKNPSSRVEIEGHCDERGSDEYNLALGDRRAKAAKNYLVTLGLKADRLSTISYGKEKPVDQGHDEAAWAKNRRAEFVIIK